MSHTPNSFRMINGRSNRAQRRKEEKELETKLHTISVMVRNENGKPIYQWGSNTGQWFSPVLEDMAMAFRYPVDVGLRLQEGMET